MTKLNDVRTGLRVFTRRRLLFAACVLLAPSGVLAGDAQWDFEVRPMPRIPSGVVVGGDTVEGWSNPVLFVRGKLSAGDTDAASDLVHKYAEMFNLVLLANVGRDEQSGYYLDKVALGFSTPIRGKNVVITSGTHKQLGANLGFIGGSVFSGNEEALKDAVQVARYRHGMIMDAPTLMNVDGRHVLRKVRHFFWVSAKTGELGTLVWTLEDTGEANYRVVGSDMQLLPPNMHEQRDMHVDGAAFTLGIPSKTAFALVRVPQGQRVPISEDLRAALGVRSFNQSSYVRLLTRVSGAIKAAPLAANR